jgi:hypothetical protein
MSIGKQFMVIWCRLLKAPATNQRATIATISKFGSEYRDETGIGGTIIRRAQEYSVAKAFFWFNKIVFGTT